MYLEPLDCGDGCGGTARGACEGCDVRDASICATLPTETLEALYRLGHVDTIPRGAALFWEGDAAPMVGNVREGVLKLTASLPDGREQMLGIALPGDFVGRPFGARAGYRVTALTDARLCTFRRAAFDDFAVRHADLAHALLLRTLGELDRAQRWMLLLGRKTANERVASLLAEIADRAGAREGERVPLLLTRGQMAELLGLTIETVSRRFTALRESRVLALPDSRSMIMLDRAALDRLSGCC